MRFGEYLQSQEAGSSYVLMLAHIANGSRLPRNRKEDRANGNTRKGVWRRPLLEAEWLTDEEMKRAEMLRVFDKLAKHG